MDRIKQYPVKLDFIKNVQYKPINLVQYDVKGADIVMTLTSNGVVVDLNNCTVTMEVKKADGTINVTQLTEITDNIVTFTPDINDVACVGKCIVTLTAYRDDGKATSLQFYYNVTASLIQDDSVTSQTAYPILDSLISEVNGLMSGTGTGTGTGDMLKATYDSNSDGKVDNANNADTLQTYQASTLPVSTPQQTALNLKTDNSVVTNHTGNTVIHVTQIDKDKWNSAGTGAGDMLKSTYDPNDDGKIDYSNLSNIPTIPTTTDALTDSVDKRFVTDAQKTVLGNTSGANTGDQSLTTYALISALPTKISQLSNDSAFIPSSGAPVQSVVGRTGDVVLTSTDVGLSNVNNTSDINKSVSTAGQTALNLKANQTDLVITNENVATKANAVQSAWMAPILLNGWVNFGSSYATAGYMKDSMGFVHIKGMIKSGVIAQGTQIFNIPAGYRPAQTTYFMVTTNPATCMIYVDMVGNVTVVSGASASDTIINTLPYIAEL